MGRINCCAGRANLNTFFMPSQLTTKFTPFFRRKRTAGFTLVEMAVVVVIMAIALTMGLRLLQATQESAAWSETKIKQERIKVALISFLRTNGRLPCPNSVAPWDGAEDSPCLGNLGRGVVPWQILGLSIADVQDGWSNFFTYRVANQTPATSSNWTIKTGAGAFSIRELTLPQITFSLRERDAAGALGTAIAPNPVAMIVSHGKNGAGARTIRGTLNAAPIGVDELLNANAASTSFISRTPNDVAGSAGGVFDDLIAYVTPSDLLQPLINEGTLKACVSYCSGGSSTPVTTITSNATCSTTGVGICTCPSGAGVLGTPAQGTCNGNITKVSCDTCVATTTAPPAAPLMPCTTTAIIPVGANPAICP